MKLLLEPSYYIKQRYNPAATRWDDGTLATL